MTAGRRAVRGLACAWIVVAAGCGGPAPRDVDLTGISPRSAETARARKDAGRTPKTDAEAANTAKTPPAAQPTRVKTPTESTAAPRRPARPTTDATSGVGGMAALEQSAKLDTKLKRKVEAWDRAVEAGLRAQVDAQVRGNEAMRALRDTLRTRIDRGPVDVVDLYLAGRLEGKLGDVEAARSAFERALTLDDRFVYAHEGLALCEGQRLGVGDDDPLVAMRVEKRLAKAFDIWPDFPRGWLVLGQFRLNRLDPRGALEHFARIPREHPAYAEGVINICRCHLLMREPERAVIKLTDALERDTENLFYREMLGQALLEKGDAEAAEAAFTYVHERAPKRPLTLLGLAQVDEARGRREEAFRRYREVAADENCARDARRDAMKGIARLRGATQAPSARELLYQLENSRDPADRRSAAAKLWPVGGEVLIRAFYTRINVKLEPDAGVRVYAVRALATHALGSSIEIFSHLLNPEKEPSKLVRGAAAGALAGVPIEYAPLDALVAALGDEEGYVFRQARATLERVSGRRLRLDLAGDLDRAARAQVEAAWREWLAARKKP